MTKKQKKSLQQILIALALVILLKLLLRVLPALPTPVELLLYLIPYFVVGKDVLRKAIKGVKNRQPFDECFLMAVATVGAFALGDYVEGCAVILFYQIGELFQSVAVGKSRQSISSLMDIRPDYANVEDEDGKLEQVDPDDVEVGTVIVVQPGERVPIDGVIVEGTSALNTAALTGESLPRDVQTGDEVISGCVNMTGLLKVRTTKEFGESTVSKILDLVENSSMKKARAENFITRFARVYTPAVCYGALALAFLPQIVVMCQSFIERSFSGVIKGVNLNNYRTIMSRLGRNIRNTYVFSIIAIVFIIIVGILVSYILVRKKGKIANLIDTLIMFPYVIPGSVLGIGLIVAFNRKPVVLVGTAAIMIISYVIRKLPYTVRSGSAFLYQMDPFIEEASINLGVSPMKTFFTVTARMMLPGIMSGAVLSWITCINELSSSIMLYSGKTSTIAVAIYQEVMRMSDGTASALATILTLTTIISLVVVFRLTKGKVKIV